jgi:hypothetical protein
MKWQKGKAVEAESVAKRDPNDVVAHVLNYSFLGVDDGTYQDASDKCIYRLFNRLLGVQEINLKTFDPRNITFSNESNNYGTIFTIIRHDITIINNFSYALVGQLNIERLQRGWTLIYSNYCRGRQKEF